MSADGKFSSLFFSKTFEKRWKCIFLENHPTNWIFVFLKKCKNSFSLKNNSNLMEISAFMAFVMSVSLFSEKVKLHIA